MQAQISGRPSLNTANRSQPGWGLYFLWVAATIGGSLLSLSAILVMTSIMGWRLPSTYLLAESVVTACVGIVISILQGLALRYYLPGLYRKWVVASSVGYFVGAMVGIQTNWLLRDFFLHYYTKGKPNVVDFSDVYLGHVLEVAIPLLLVGLMVGLAQALSLRSQVLRAGWWVLASALAWGTAGAIFMIALRDPLIGDNTALSTFTLLLGLFVLGSITGGMLVELLRKPVIYAACE
jgi:hypothetical protein